MTTNSTWAALRNPAGLLLALLALFLIPVDLFAWTNGELLIWMDADRGQARDSAVKQMAISAALALAWVDLVENFRIKEDNGE